MLISTVVPVALICRGKRASGFAAVAFPARAFIVVAEVAEKILAAAASGFCVLLQLLETFHPDFLEKRLVFAHCPRFNRSGPESANNESIASANSAVPELSDPNSPVEDW